MQLPEVEIKPTDSLRQAERRVEDAYEERGGTLLAFENLNSVLPTSSFCHFFQSRVEGRECVITVMAAEWEEKSVLTVLNVLLNIRLDPDPPGQTPLFRFYGAHPVPPVLLTLFGDSLASDFECRAALVARFAAELLPSQALQLAAVAMHLLRECLGVRTSFFDADGEAQLARAIVEDLKGAGFKEGGAPLNTLIVIGFLYGEMLRGRLPHESRWVRLKDGSPWPVIAFGKVPSTRDASAEDEPEDAATGVPQVVFSPIASVLAAHQDGIGDRLRTATATLAAKCGEEL